MIGTTLAREDIDLLNKAISEAKANLGHSKAGMNNIQMLSTNLKGLQLLPPNKGFNPHESSLLLFSPNNLDEQLKNPNSILFKYFTSMIINFVSKKEELTKLFFERALKEEKKKIFQDEMIVEGRALAEKERIGRSNIEYERNINNLENKLRQSNRGIELNLCKAKELNHWLGLLANNPDLDENDLAQAQDLIESRYDLIQKNLDTLDQLESHDNLTAEQKAEVKDSKAIYERHLDLSTFENMKENLKKHSVDIESKDKDPLQVLRKLKVHEEVFEKFHKKLTDKIIDSTTSEGRDISDAIKKQTASSGEEKQTTSFFQLLFSGLNDAFEKFFKNNPDPSFLSGHPENRNNQSIFDDVLEILNSITEIKSPDVAKHGEMIKKIDGVIDKLTENGIENCKFPELLNFFTSFKAKNLAEERTESEKPSWTKYSPPINFELATKLPKF